MYRRNLRFGARVLLFLILFIILVCVSSVPSRGVIEETLPPTTTTEVPTTTATEPSTEVIESTIEETQETVPETIPEEVTVPLETEFVSYYAYTDEELDLLARLIHSEGNSESYDTKLKIGSVVMNRVEDPSFPNTIYEVIYQKSQFSVTVLKIGDVIMIDQPADEESYMAAKEILDYGSVLPSTVQVFYAYYCTEPWVTSRVTYERSDNTIFAHIYGG